FEAGLPTAHPLPLPDTGYGPEKAGAPPAPTVAGRVVPHCDGHHFLRRRCPVSPTVGSIGPALPSRSSLFPSGRRGFAGESSLVPDLETPQTRNRRAWPPAPISCGVPPTACLTRETRSDASLLHL